MSYLFNNIHTGDKSLSIRLKNRSIVELLCVIFCNIVGEYINFLQSSREWRIHAQEFGDMIKQTTTTLA